MNKKPKPLGQSVATATNRSTNSRSVHALNIPDRRHPVWERPVTPKQLAKFLQVSPRTVSRLTKQRTFPVIKVEGQTRFVPNDVLDYLRKQSKGSK